MSDKITVPVCMDCNKPLTGRSKAIDRCWCDTVGRWTMQEIDKEQAPIEPKA